MAATALGEHCSSVLWCGALQCAVLFLMEGTNQVSPVEQVVSPHTTHHVFDPPLNGPPCGVTRASSQSRIHEQAPCFKSRRAVFMASLCPCTLKAYLSALSSDLTLPVKLRFLIRSALRGSGLR
ncbi:unnamed protein product [Boreogadus saida]